MTYDKPKRLNKAQRVESAPIQQMTVTHRGEHRGQPAPDRGSEVVKAVLMVSGSFATATGMLLAVAGMWGTPDNTVRYALAAILIITLFALWIASAYIRGRGNF